MKMTTSQLHKVAKTFGLTTAPEFGVFADWLEEQGEVEWSQAVRLVVKVESSWTFPTDVKSTYPDWSRWFLTEGINKHWLEGAGFKNWKCALYRKFPIYYHELFGYDDCPTTEERRLQEVFDDDSPATEERC